MAKQSVFGKFLIWRIKNISDKQFMLIASIVVGLAAGLSAVVIKNSVYFIRKGITYGFSGQYQNYLYFIYPAIGILIVVIFVKYILKKHVGHSITGVLYAISQKNSIIKPHNIYSSLIGSVITVGFGGSVGLEGPTVATGSAIGSNIGRLLRINHRQITLLLGCGCAGAISAIFKAPIAGILFTLEVLMLDLTMYSLVPLLLSSAAATLISYFFLGQDVLYPFDVKEHFIIANLPLYIVLGILTGFVSVYFSKIYMSVGRLFDRFETWYKKLIFGGLVLGILIFFMPALYGEGYEAINYCLNGNYSYLFHNSMFYDYRENIIAIMLLFGSIVVFKVIATAATFGSGGMGGIFAPALFMGANTGFLFAIACNKLGFVHISESKFALVGMAGLISGVLHAPLTAIFLIAEITGGYALFMPLIITATISYATIKYFESNSVYTKLLSERKQLITHDKDKSVLSMMKINDLIETDFKTVNQDATLGGLVRVVAESQRNIFPVVDEANNLLGIVTMDDIRRIMFDPEMYDTTFVRDLMFMPETVVDPYESMEEVAGKFQSSGKYNLPVVEDGKYAGFISRANLFSSYRKMLKKFSEE